MKKIIFIVLFILTSFSIFPCEIEGHFDFVMKDSKGVVLYYGCYDAKNNGPHIIEYYLTRWMVEQSNVNRPSASFAQNRDGNILQLLLRSNGYNLIADADYTNSGFDRGHMAPNDDFNYSEEHALLTFFIGNVWPQLASVNRGTWLQTENETRRLAAKYGLIRIVIIVDEFKEQWIGRNKNIRVPSVFKRRVYHHDELIYSINISQ